jgi:hypothetical protein
MIETVEYLRFPVVTELGDRIGEFCDRRPRRWFTQDRARTVGAVEITEGAEESHALTIVLDESRGDGPVTPTLTDELREYLDRSDRWRSEEVRSDRHRIGSFSALSHRTSGHRHQIATVRSSVPDHAPTDAALRGEAIHVQASYGAVGIEACSHVDPPSRM